MACDLTAAECMRRQMTALGAAERGGGWWSLRCPVGHHGQPLRFHVGDRVHISWTDLGKCAEPDVYAWLIRQGIPQGCLKRPKDWRPPERAKDFGTEDGKLADLILAEAFGEGTPTERMIRMVVHALGEVPEGAVCDALAGHLRLKRRIIFQATAPLRKK